MVGAKLTYLCIAAGLFFAPVPEIQGLDSQGITSSDDGLPIADDKGEHSVGVTEDMAHIQASLD